MSDCSKNWTMKAKNGLAIVVPNNDSRTHSDFSPLCLCRPKVYKIEDGTIIIHNSYDGREYHEPDNEKYDLIQ